MSLEAYVTNLMKERNPRGFDAAFAGFLSLLEKLYLKGVRKRRARETANAVEAGIPVISVGNVTAGGAGKTPCILMIAELLLKEGKKPAIISRGYKSGLEKKGGVVSDGKSILVSQKEAGDEPYMMALRLPTVPVLVGKDRKVSAKKAVALGADVLLLDDGFQYWGLDRDRDIVLIDCMNPFGYFHALPRGLLREPLTALGRASLFLLTKSDKASDEEKLKIKRVLRHYGRTTPILETAHSPSKIAPYETWKKRIHEGELPAVSGKKAFLVSGIGNPASFAETASEAGLVRTGDMSFPDHHAYTDEDVRKAIKEAERSGADLIAVTEKDAVKLMNLESVRNSKMPFYVLEIEMTIKGHQEEILEEQWEELL